jgi:hypothetical protein
LEWTVYSILKLKATRAEERRVLRGAVEKREEAKEARRWLTLRALAHQKKGAQYSQEVLEDEIASGPQIGCCKDGNRAMIGGVAW